MVATTAYPAAFGQGTGPLLLNVVGCTGTESSLLNCGHLDVFECLFYNDVGVVCPSCKSCFNRIIVSSELNE